MLVIGAGVAGLQAIAIVERAWARSSPAYDVRPADVRQQIESLGAKFVQLDLDDGSAEAEGRLREGS